MYNQLERLSIHLKMYKQIYIESMYNQLFI